MPGHLILLSRWAKRKAWRATHLGAAVECPCCGIRLSEFMPSGTVRRKNAECPRCGSRERHRFHALLLTRRCLLGSREQPVRCLFAAPDHATQQVLTRSRHCTVTTTDLYLPKVDVRADLTALPFEDGSFERIICSNVLEHIPDDVAAMRELYRVLAPAGVLLVDVPIRADGTFDEDVSLADGAVRARRFGGRDHHRWYDAVTFTSRLHSVGFEVERVDAQHVASGTERDRFRIDNDPVFLARKA